MGKIKNVCLDTTAIRNIIHEEKDYPEILKEIVDKFKVKFKIAETAWAELVQDFYDNTIKIDEWKKVKDKINDFLFLDCPIQEQGYNLSVDMDTFKKKKERVGFYNKEYWKKCWQLLYQINSSDDLKKRFFYYHEHKPYTIKIHPELIKDIFENNRMEWYGYFDLVKKTAEPGSKFGKIIEIFTGEFEKDYNVDKMIDVIHALSWFTYLYLQKTPYNPKSDKRRNDSIDFTFLQILSKPAIFCTEDGKFQTLIKESKAPNADNVKKIQELIDYYG